MARKKEILIEEIFCEMPMLKKAFKQEENFIKRYGEGNGENPAIKKRQKKKEELLHTAQNLRGIDLEIIYNLNKLKYVDKQEILSALKKTNEAYEVFEEKVGLKQNR